MDRNEQHIHPPPGEHDVLEPLERLEALLIVMLNADLGSIAPASLNSLLALAHDLTVTAIDAASTRHPSA